MPSPGMRRRRRRAHAAAGVLLAFGAACARPQGGAPAAHVFTFVEPNGRDQVPPEACLLALTVEAAGGSLNLIGMYSDHESELPGGIPERYREKAWMVRKQTVFLRHLRGVPANETVLLVDAFDVIFQRPLSEVVAAYRRLAAPSVKTHGIWPVIYGGEQNCWPFPHQGKIPVHATKRARAHRGSADWVHRIPKASALSAEHVPHLGSQRFPYGDWGIRGDQFCRQWLSDLHGAGGARRHARFPFLCAGVAVGTASSFRRVVRLFMAMHIGLGEYDDQAILAATLLRNPALGFVDVAGEIFLQLHGYQHRILERPLCGEGYLQRVGPASASRPLLESFRPPALRNASGATPAVLHFNGNGKRFRSRCARHFLEAGLLGQQPLGDRGDPMLTCDVYDHDRSIWIWIMGMRPEEAKANRAKLQGNAREERVQRVSVE